MERDKGLWQIILNKAKLIIDNDELFIKDHKEVKAVVTDLGLSTIIVVRVIILLGFSIALEKLLGMTSLSPRLYKNISIWLPALIVVILYLRRKKDEK